MTTVSTTRPAFSEMDEAALEDLLGRGRAPRGAWLAWARAAGKRSAWATALKRWEQFRAAHPNAELQPYHLGRAAALHMLSRGEDADAELSELIQGGNRSPSAMTAWAMSAFRLDNFRLAATRLEQCIAWAEPAEARRLSGLHLTALLTCGSWDVMRGEIEPTLLRTDLAEVNREAIALDRGVGIGIALAAGIAGQALADLLSARFVEAAAAHGLPAAAQHVRNLLAACAWRQFPAGFEACAASDVPASSYAQLRLAVPALDAALRAFLPEGDLARGRTFRPKDPGHDGPCRVLVVASYLPRNETGPHLRLVTSYAAALAAMPGVAAVGVLATEELSPEGPRVRDAPNGGESLRDHWARDARMLAGDAAERMTLLQPDPDGPVHPQAEAYRLALGFRPDVLMTLEGLYASPVVGKALALGLPTLAVQSSADNGDSPHADIVLAHGWQKDFADRTTPARWRRQPIPVIPFPRIGTIAEADLGPTGLRRVATALSNGRLERRLLEGDGAFAGEIAAFLAREPDAAWILVGVTDEAAVRTAFAPYAPEGSGSFDGRLRVLGHVPDLRAVFAHSALYFHPQRPVGGAMGIAMAVAEGVPVVAPVDCDAANFLPRGRLYDGQAAGLHLLALLYRSERARAQLAAMQSRFVAERHSLAAVGETLARLIPVVRTRFARREGRGEPS